jgi:hypothetical protein
VKNCGEPCPSWESTLPGNAFHFHSSTAQESLGHCDAHATDFLGRASAQRRVELSFERPTLYVRVPKHIFDNNGFTDMLTHVV